MGAKPGRNKRGVTQKGNAGNGKDQMSHASIIFSSFWHKKNPHLHYCWNQLQTFCWLYSNPELNTVDNTAKCLCRKEMNREYIDFSLKAQDWDREDNSWPGFLSQRSTHSDADFRLNQEIFFCNLHRSCACFVTEKGTLKLHFGCSLHELGLSRLSQVTLIELCGNAQ